LSYCKYLLRIDGIHAFHSYKCKGTKIVEHSKIISEEMSNSYTYSLTVKKLPFKGLWKRECEENEWVIEGR
jgi:hypothetical protein